MYKDETFSFDTQFIQFVVPLPDLQNVEKDFLLTNLFSNNNNEFETMYIHSPSLHKDLYQKTKKCFINYIPIHIIPKFLNGEDIDLIIDEIVNDEDFEISDTEIETYESKEGLKHPQEIEDGGIIIMDYSNEKKSIFEFKQCSNDQHMIIFLFSSFLKITMKYQKELSEQLERYTT